MAFPVSTKTICIIGSIIGAPAIGVTCWQLAGTGGSVSDPEPKHDHVDVPSVPKEDTQPIVTVSGPENINTPVQVPASPSQPANQAKEVTGSSWSISTFERILSGKDANSQSNNFLSGTQTCFNSFFPNVASTLYLPGYDSTNPYSEVTEKPPTNSEQSDSAGCTFMQLAHNQDNNKFVFISETSVRNNNVGLVVWTTGTNTKVGSNVSSSYGHDHMFFLKYYVFGLEKSDNSWSPKWGFMWFDLTIMQANQSSLLISSPNGELKVVYDFDKNKSQSEETINWTHKKYLGVWQSVSSGSASVTGAEIFEKITVISSEKDKNPYGPELLGRKWGDFSQKTGDSEQREYGYNKITKIADTSEFSKGSLKWISTPGESDVDKHNTLNEWYKPFKGKKGSWAKCKDDFSISALGAEFSPGDIGGLCEIDNSN